MAEALEEAIAAGARPKVAEQGSLGLTPSELRVARRAAAGQSKREIAQGLFVTQKTVETHQSRVYRKLEISSRAQLPDRLRDQVPEA
jgi:DNA-binding CsgD family transcriptional regulator